MTSTQLGAGVGHKWRALGEWGHSASLLPPPTPMGSLGGRCS